MIRYGLLIAIILLPHPDLEAAKAKGVKAASKSSTIKVSGGTAKISNANASLEGLTIEVSAANKLSGSFNTNNTTLKIASNGTNLVVGGVTNVANNTLPAKSGNANQDLEFITATSLDASLSFASGKKFSGTIDAAGQSVKTDATPRTYSSNARLLNMLDLEFLGETTLATQWTFEGDAVVSGNGNILDLSPSGTIVVAPDTELTLANLVLRGLGNAPGLGKIYLTDKSSVLKLTNTTVELDDDYTFTRGGIYVVGPTTIITADHTLTIDQQASMTVDNVTLYYDTLTFSDDANIAPEIADESTNPVYVVSVNNGQILHANPEGGVAPPAGDEIISSDLTLSELAVASPSTKFIFTSSATLDGASFPLIFTRADIPVVEVDDAVEARFTDIRLEHVAPSLIGLGAGATVVFDDAVELDLAKDDALEDTWTFRGACRINGQGSTLDLSAGDLVIQGADSSLLIENIVITGLAGSAIRCTDNTQTVTFKNVTFLLDDTFTMTKGRFEVDGVCLVQGDGTFEYASAVASKVNAGGTLALDGATFHYAPAVANRDLIIFDTAAARMSLNGATLSSTTTGMRLTRGTLILDHKNIINASGSSVSSGISIGNGSSDYDLDIKLFPGASLNTIAGRLIYANVDA